jgi:hypothetical protein
MLKQVLILGILISLVIPRPTAGEEGTSPPVETGDDPPAEAVEAQEAGEAGMVTCFWKSILPSRDFQPSAGGGYRITVTGADRTRLSFSYQRLNPHDGEVRIAVHTRKTSDNRILVDQGNPALFTAETGEFILSLVVPSGWPLYLVEDSDNPYADPVVLSNIVELP